MICQKCGTEIADGTKICPSCGHVQEFGNQGNVPEFLASDDADRSAQPKPDFSVPTDNLPTYDDDAVFAAAMDGGPAYDTPTAEPDFSVPDATGSMPHTDGPGHLASDSNAPEPDFSVSTGEAPTQARHSASTGRVRREATYAETGSRRPHAEASEGAAMPKSHRRAVVICAALAVVVGAGIAYAAHRFAQSSEPSPSSERPAVTQALAVEEDTQEEQEAPAEPTRYDVAIPVAIEGLNEEGSRIPIQLQGTMHDGTGVDEQVFLAHDGTGLKLAQGTYEVAILASPIAADGTLYTIPTTIAIDLREDGSFELKPGDALEFEAIDAEAVTDGQIEEAVDWVRKDPERADAADRLAEAARSRRDDALAEAQKQSKEEDEEESTSTQDTTQTTQTTTTDDTTYTTESSTNYDSYDDYSDYTDYDYSDYDYGTDDSSQDSDSGSSDSGSSSDGGSSSDSGSTGSDASSGGADE